MGEPLLPGDDEGYVVFAENDKSLEIDRGTWAADKEYTHHCCSKFPRYEVKRKERQRERRTVCPMQDLTGTGITIWQPASCKVLHGEWARGYLVDWPEWIESECDSLAGVYSRSSMARPSRLDDETPHCHHGCMSLTSDGGIRVRVSVNTTPSATRGIYITVASIG